MLKRWISFLMVLVLLVTTSTFTSVAAGETPYQKYASHPQIKLWGSVVPYNDASAGLTDTPSIIPYIAKNNPTGICAVIFPGGGYGNLSKTNEGSKIAEFLNSKGISAFVVYYRTTNGGTMNYDYRAIMSDGLRAVKYVRYNATEFAINPQRIFTIGFSAGGHLTSMTATNFDFQVSDPKYTPDAIDAVSARPDAAAPCYAVSSICKPYSHKGTRTVFARGNAQIEEKYSAENAVTTNTPPVFLWHTWNDPTVPAEASLAFAAALEAKNIPCELHIYANGGHGLNLAAGNATAYTWSAHLTAWAFRTFSDK